MDALNKTIVVKPWVWPKVPNIITHSFQSAFNKSSLLPSSIPANGFQETNMALRVHVNMKGVAVMTLGWHGFACVGDAVCLLKGTYILRSSENMF